VPYSLQLSPFCGPVSLGAAVLAFLAKPPFARIRSAELLPAQWPQATFATEC
jgi:hypothetical protein